MSLPVLPDVIGFGPLAFPTGPLATVAGTVVVYVLAVKLAERADARAGSAGPAAPAPSPATVPHSPQAPSPVADPALVDRLFTRVAIGLLLGAKAADILGSPLSFIHNPRLLIAWPGGPTAAIGAVIGALLLAGPLARRWREIPAVLDVVATPLLLGLGVVALGLRDARVASGGGSRAGGGGSRRLTAAGFIPGPYRFRGRRSGQPGGGRSGFFPPGSGPVWRHQPIPGDGRCSRPAGLWGRRGHRTGPRESGARGTAGPRRQGIVTLLDKEGARRGGRPGGVQRRAAARPGASPSWGARSLLVLHTLLTRRA